MKRGSSVLQPPCDAAKRRTHTHTRTHTGALSVSRAAGQHTPGSSPFPSATSLFSRDVGSKMASDLLIRLSEATQKAQVHPGSSEGAEPQRREALMDVCGGQQDEPGLALSPDGPGASPEPPPLTHTPDGGAIADTLASELLRKLAEQQEVSVRVKEEEEPVEVSDLVAEDMTLASLNMASQHVLTVKREEQGLRGNESSFFTGDPSGDAVASAANQVQLRVKMEDNGAGGAEATQPLFSGFLYEAEPAERPLSVAERSSSFLCAVKPEELCPAGGDVLHLPGAKMEEQLLFGAKMEEQRLRAALWQDMTVNLASTLLHQLSERVGKASSQLTPVTSSPVLKVNGDLQHSFQHTGLKETTPAETQTLSRDQTPGYFYRCHVCGFETEGRVLFQGHMTEHRQWEHGSFSLHCCVCDHSTNQEAEMRAHANIHVQGHSGIDADMRCPITPPATTASSGSTPIVAMATQPGKSSSEHRCRICQRSFPGQQELLVHFQGHRQGNQYRCDRCGHLTRTANKLVEHVRVHTGERPFTCDLCPYSAKRRDSLRLHCKVKHATADTPGDVHTHRSYAHADNQRSNKHVQRLHTPASRGAAAHASSCLTPPHPSLWQQAGWRDLSPLVPITTLVSLKPRPHPSPPPSSSALSCSSKLSLLGYLGLTSSL